MYLFRNHRSVLFEWFIFTLILYLPFWLQGSCFEGQACISSLKIFHCNSWHCSIFQIVCSVFGFFSPLAVNFSRSGIVRNHPVPFSFAMKSWCFIRSKPVISMATHCQTWQICVSLTFKLASAGGSSVSGGIVLRAYWTTGGLEQGGESQLKKWISEVL